MNYISVSSLLFPSTSTIFRRQHGRLDQDGWENETDEGTDCAIEEGTRGERYVCFLVLGTLIVICVFWSLEHWWWFDVDMYFLIMLEHLMRCDGCLMDLYFQIDIDCCHPKYFISIWNIANHCLHSDEHHSWLQECWAFRSERYQTQVRHHSREISQFAGGDKKTIKHRR